MPEYKFKYELTNKTVETLIDQMKKSKKWILRPEYQRDVVWTEGQKGAFISSIIEGVAIPPIIYNYDPETKKFICIDGQQRLVSILDYVKNRFGVQVEDDLVFFSDIPEEYEDEDDVRKMTKDEQARFNLRNLVVYQYDNLEYQDQIDIFLRNQYGKALTPGEKIKSRITSSDVSKEYHQFCDKQYELIQKFCKRDRRQHLAFLLPLILIATTDDESIPNAKRVDKYLRELTIEVLHQDVKQTEKLLKVLFSKNLLNSEKVNQKAPTNLIYIMALYLEMNYDMKKIGDDVDELKALRQAFVDTINFVQASTTITANKTKDMSEKIIKIIEAKLAQNKSGKTKKATAIIDESSSHSVDSEEQEEESESQEESSDVDEDKEDKDNKENSEESEESSEPNQKLDEFSDSDVEEIVEPKKEEKKNQGKVRRYVKAT